MSKGIRLKIFFVPFRGVD